MKHPGFSTLLAMVLLAPTISSCSVEPETTESETQGVIPSRALGKMIPKVKTPAQLSAFSKGMVSSFGKHSAASVDAAAKHKALLKSLAMALDEADGVPRSQLEDTFEVLVAPTSANCGGASCARVFGLKETEIAEFLDKSRELIAKTPVQAQKDKVKLRDLLIASLTREEDIVSPSKPLKEILAELPEVQLKITPRPKASLMLEHPKKILSESEIKQIQAYSHIFSTQLRAIEANHVENLLSAGYSPTAIRDARTRVATINRALAKLPQVPGTTYRGINNVSDSTITELFRFRQGKRLITLGQKNLPALTSSSWDMRVAEAFAMGSNKTKHSIIYIIKQRTGKTIEHLSRYPGEAEVLIPSDALFQVGQIAYVNRAQRVLSVELIQVLKP